MPTYHSQSQQDFLLDRAVLRGMRHGVFVDIGAHDGVTFSNTLMFEPDRGWTGLCIDANPMVFESLVKHRTAKCLNVAIADHEGSLPFIEVLGYSEMLSGLAGNMVDEHLARIDREIARHGGSPHIIDVPTKRVDQILHQNDPREIHYLSVDTEGSESAILTTVDQARHFVHVVNAE